MTIQQRLDDAWAAQEAAYTGLEQAYADYQLKVLKRFGPMAFTDWDESHDGTPIDLSGYVETFRDDFDVMSIGRVDAVPGAGDIKWVAAGHTDFGNVDFRQPGDYWDPYVVENGECKLHMTKLSSTTTPPLPAGDTTPWKSSIIQTVNRSGVGFAQGLNDGLSGVFFEARIMLPTDPNNPGVNAKVPGAWHSFWLLSENEFTPDGRDNPGMELDVFEDYGTDPRATHATVHYKPNRVLLPGQYPVRQTKSNYVGLAGVKPTGSTVPCFDSLQSNVFAGVYHNRAVMIDREVGVRIYYDGIELCRMPYLDFMGTRMYMLVNMTLFRNDTDNADALCLRNQELKIDWVRAMAKP
jgi:hypothetical protein